MDATEQVTLQGATASLRLPPYSTWEHTGLMQAGLGPGGSHPRGMSWEGWKWLGLWCFPTGIPSVWVACQGHCAVAVLWAKGEVK